MNALQKTDEPQGGQVVAINDSAALMTAVARAASDPNVDVEKMERLFAMHERMEQRQAQADFATAMMATQAALPKIVKDRHNSQTGSDYATLDRMIGQIAPVYTGQGLSLSFGTEDSPMDGHVRIVCRVLHKAGHSEEYRYDSPLDSAGIAGKVNKTPTHARGSAITYGRRYLTLMIFNLSTGYDDDGNGASEPEPPDQKAADWIKQVELLQEPGEWAPLKKKMMADYGGVVKNIPDAVKQAFVDVKARIMPKDEAE